MSPHLADKDYPFNLCESVRLTCIALSTTTYDRTYVPIGAPAWDIFEECITQLTVHLVSAFRAAPGRQEDRNRITTIPAARPALQLEVGFVHCVTALDDDSSIPATSVLQAETKSVMAEGWTLWFELIKAQFAGTLFSAVPEAPDWDPPECNRVEIDPIVPAGPQGGVAGYRIPVLVSLG